MSGENWTPGPWFVNPTPLADGRARVEDGRQNGLESIKCEWTEAHLVAAAPNLYQSLSEVLGWMEHCPGAGHRVTEDTAEDCLACREIIEARYALAKARGEDT